MKPIYEEIEMQHSENCIKASYDNGLVLFIPKDPANSDYQRYLRWLENPDADESGTL